MTGAFGDMGNLLKQAQHMQSEVDRIEKELAATVLKGSAGGGAVEVEVTGDGMCKKVTISPEALAKGEREMIEDLVLAAVRDGLARARALKKERMQRAMGGLNLPGLF